MKKLLIALTTLAFTSSLLCASTTPQGQNEGLYGTCRNAFNGALNYTGNKLSAIWNEGGREFCYGFAGGVGLNLAGNAVNYYLTPKLTDQEKNGIATEVKTNLLEKIKERATDDQTALAKYYTDKYYKDRGLSQVSHLFSSYTKDNVPHLLQRDIKSAIDSKTKFSTIPCIPLAISEVSSFSVPLAISLQHTMNFAMTHIEKKRTTWAAIGGLLGYIASNTIIKKSGCLDKNQYTTPKDEN